MQNSITRGNFPRNKPYRVKEGVFGFNNERYDYIDSVAKTCILNVLRYFQAEKMKGDLIVPFTACLEVSFCKPQYLLHFGSHRFERVEAFRYLDSIVTSYNDTTVEMKRTAAACNISKRIVDKVLLEYRQTGTLKTSKPIVKYYGEKRKHPKTKLKPLDPVAIRNVIYDMFENKEAVNRLTIHKKLRRYGLFPGAINHLMIILKKMGVERVINEYNVHCYKMYNYEDDDWMLFEETTDEQPLKKEGSAPLVENDVDDMMDSSVLS